MDYQREQSATHRGTRRSSEGPTAADLLSQMNQLNQTISSMIMDGLNQMLASGTTTRVASGRSPRDQEREQPRRRRRHEGGCDCDCDCDCPKCERDDCYCRCCIGDADLVIYARLFELRVIPITLVNERRREKNIHLELSEFKTRGGETLGVKAGLLPPVDFVLPPCGEEKIIIAVETFPAGDDQAGKGISSARFQTSAAARELPDVDECRVLYADLRVEGCDIRPIRIALALLPRDCDEYEIDCGCSCC